MEHFCWWTGQKAKAEERLSSSGICNQVGKPSIRKEQTVSFFCLRLFWAESKLTKKNRGKEATFSLPSNFQDFRQINALLGPTSWSARSFLCVLFSRSKKCINLMKIFAKSLPIKREVRGQTEGDHMITVMVGKANASLCSRNK